MTEPVAYMWKTKRGTIVGLKPNDDNHSQGVFGRIPLYTKEQLTPHVKMTKKQYDRLMWDKENTDLSTCLEYFINSDGNNDFGLPSENLRGDLTQEDIAQAWLNPEEAIEIVPNMKWFVRSKKRDDEGDYLFLSGSNLDDLDYLVFDYAMAFDTKEEAELWKNPLTEAVQLSMEGE